MLIAIIPIIVMVVGLLMYVLASNPKVAQIGFVLFACGTLVTTFVLGGETLRIGR